MGEIQGWARTQRVLPAKLGLDNVVVAAASPVTSAAFTVDGYNQLTLSFQLTRVAATAISVFVEFSFDGTTWFRAQSSTLAGGTETITDHTVSKAVTASGNWWHNFGGVLGVVARIVVGSTAGTTDRVTVNAILGVV